MKEAVYLFFTRKAMDHLVRKRRQTSSIIGKRLQTAMSLRGAPPACTSPLWLCLVQHLQLTFKQLPFFF